MRAFKSSSLLQSVLCLLLSIGMFLPGVRTANVEFDCGQIPEICKNMCWGAFCVRNDIFGNQLVRQMSELKDGVKKRQLSGADTTAYTSPDGSLKRGTLKNPCTVLGFADKNGLPPGATRSSIDEYPFAKTAQGGLLASLRCVQTDENTAQGIQFNSELSRNNIADGEMFTVTFTNIDGLGKDNYCSDSRRCINDGYQFFLQGEEYFLSLGKDDPDPPGTSNRQRLSRSIAKQSRRAAIARANAVDATCHIPKFDQIVQSVKGYWARVW